MGFGSWGCFSNFYFQFDRACFASNNSQSRTGTSPDIQTGKDDKNGGLMFHFVGRDRQIDGIWHRLE
jgi:hypothetical protein